MAAIAEYPLQLGIAYVFLAGYLMRTLFISMQLPASVGVILSGFAFSWFFQQDILLGRDHLQELAFFLILLMAGLEIRIQDLRPYIFVMALLPASLELVGIAVYAKLVLGYTRAEGLVLGAVLVCIGDGLVIPKMKEFGARFKGHPMPQLVFTWAPLEACFGLTVFGILVGLSAPADQPSPDMRLLVVANILRIVATVAAGALLGTVSGWLVTWRTEVTFRGQPVFTGWGVEAFLMVLAVALLAFGLGDSEGGRSVVPMGFSSGSLFQPELLVIVTGTWFAHAAQQKVLNDVEDILGGVLMFGQLVLFSMLGSRTAPGIFPRIPQVLPIMVVGVFSRLVGVFLATFVTLSTTPAEHCPFAESTAVRDALFCFLSTLPRATIQGALGSVPVTQKFFSNTREQRAAQTMIFLSARIYIVIMSVCGMILLNTLGRRLLESTAAEHAQPRCRGDDGDPHGDQAQPLQHDDYIEMGPAGMDLLRAVAGKYKLSANKVLEVLQRVSTRPLRTRSDPRADFPIKDASVASYRHLGTRIALLQFDMPGSQLALVAHRRRKEKHMSFP